MNYSIDIVKIGGSIITKKENYKHIVKESITLIADILVKSEQNYIIVHGAGSYGHVIAKKYQIKTGYDSREQITGVVKIRSDMNELNSIIVETFVEKGINAIGMQTSAMVVKNNIGDYSTFIEPLLNTLKLGIIPVLYGDVIFDTKNGFTILSGDSLCTLLAQKMNAKRVIFLTDVDGIYGKRTPTEDYHLLDVIEKAALDSIELEILTNTDKIDVTGEMDGKIKEIKEMSNYVDEVIIVNGLLPERVLAVLKNEPTICSKIVK